MNTLWKIPSFLSSLYIPSERSDPYHRNLYRHLALIPTYLSGLFFLLFEKIHFCKRVTVINVPSSRYSLAIPFSTPLIYGIVLIRIPFSFIYFEIPDEYSSNQFLPTAKLRYHNRFSEFRFQSVFVIVFSSQNRRIIVKFPQTVKFEINTISFWFYSATLIITFPIPSGFPFSENLHWIFFRPDNKMYWTRLG